MKIEDKIGDTNTKAGDVYVYEGELVLIGFDGTSVPPFVHTVFNSMQLGLPVASRNESNNEKFPIISERQYMNENDIKVLEKDGMYIGNLYDLLPEIIMEVLNRHLEGIRNYTGTVTGRSRP